MKPQNRPPKPSANSTKRGYGVSGTRQKDVRKVDDRGCVRFSLRRTIFNLRQMVATIKTDKKVADYEVVAGQLSAVAGLNNGHVWGWRYVASVLSETITPSRKFIDAVNLYSEKINPRKKQYFYFVRRHSFVMVYEKSCLREIVKAHMQERNYKMVSFKRYMEVKRITARGMFRR